MKKSVAGFAIAFVAGVAHAQSEVYLCVDESGRKEYKNSGITKGCKKVELPGIMTIPAPPKRVAPAPATVKPTSATPSDYPKVDGETQKRRDSDRRQILLDELATEERKLATLKQEFNSGEPARRGDERNYAKYQERVATMKDDVARTEKNIEALKREIGNLK